MQPRNAPRPGWQIEPVQVLPQPRFERGEDAEVAASVVKVLGTQAEGDIAELADELAGEATPGGEAFAALVRAGVLARPGFTLRGGTSEILRGVIARGLGLR